jgi:hypothetical protein
MKFQTFGSLLVFPFVPWNMTFSPQTILFNSYKFSAPSQPTSLCDGFPVEVVHNRREGWKYMG